MTKCSTGLLTCRMIGVSKLLALLQHWKVLTNNLQRLLYGPLVPRSHLAACAVISFRLFLCHDFFLRFSNQNIVSLSSCPKIKWRVFIKNSWKEGRCSNEVLRKHRDGTDRSSRSIIIKYNNTLVITLILYISGIQKDTSVKRNVLTSEWTLRYGTWTQLRTSGKFLHCHGKWSQCVQAETLNITFCDVIPNYTA